MKWKHLVPIYILMMFILIALYLVVNYNMINQHEEVHRAIFSNYGCNNISMVITPFSGYTICYDNHSLSESEETMHSFNEVVTYNNSSLIDIVFFGVLIITSTLFMLASLFRPPKNYELLAKKSKE